MSIKKCFLSLCILTLSDCSSVEVPNTRVCAVAGLMKAGADCAWTQDSTVETLSMEEFIEFLEPQPENYNPKDPKHPFPAKGAALCQSVDDWTKQKIALEKACAELKTCTYEIQRAISNIDSLMEKTSKRPFRVLE